MKEYRGLLILLSAFNFVNGINVFTIVGLLEPLSRDLGVSVAQAGWLLTSYALTFAVAAPVLVALTGRIGRRRVVTGGLAILAVASVLSAFAPTLESLLILRAIAAGGASLVTPVSLAIAAALSPPESRGRALSLVFLGLTLAQVVGAPAGSWLAFTFGWRSVFGLVAVLSLPCVWLAWTRIPPGLRFDPVSLRDLGAVLRNGVILLTLAFTVVFLGAIYMLFSFMPTLLAQTMNYGRDGITLALLAYGAAAPFGNTLGGTLSDRVGPARLLVLICLVLMIVQASFLALPMPGVLLIPLIFFWSLVGWLFGPSQQVRLVALSPERAAVLMSLNAGAL